MEMQVAGAAARTATATPGLAVHPVSVISFLEGTRAGPNAKRTTSARRASLALILATRRTHVRLLLAFLLRCARRLTRSRAEGWRFRVVP